MSSVAYTATTNRRGFLAVDSHDYLYDEDARPGNGQCLSADFVPRIANPRPGDARGMKGTWTIQVTFTPDAEPGR